MAEAAIVVGVRVRPFNQREHKYQSKCIIGMEGNCTSVTNVRKGRIDTTEKPRDFVFDHAFWTHSKEETGAAEYADQSAVYDKLGQRIVESAVTGYNSCLFAYGQTGSGKTYTMVGTPTEPGVLPRLGEHLFQEVEGMRNRGLMAAVECSFCEIYNDVVQDLTVEKNSDKGLPIRQHPKLGVFVQGIKKIAVKSPDEFVSLLNNALASRAVTATNMNATSSRSHAIVLVTVVQTDPSTGAQKTGKMSLVDLAGSERAEATGATGSTMVEAQNINYSLTVLGMCLGRLADNADPKNKSKLHVPFRDSSLSYLLSDNLGGNSKTSMIAAISPATVNYEETISTLRFASVTKKVKTVAVVNESANAKLIRELQEELAGLRDRLQTMKTATPAVSPAAPELKAPPLQVPAPAQAMDEPEGEVEEHIEENTEEYTPTPRSPMEKTLAEQLEEEEAALAELDEAEIAQAEEVLQTQPTMKPLSMVSRVPSLAIGAPSTNDSLAAGRSFVMAPLKLSLSLSKPEAQEEPHEEPQDSVEEAQEVEEAPEASEEDSGPGVDWSLPQLINLKPRGGAPVAYVVYDGENTLEFGDAQCTVTYDGLRREVAVCGVGCFHNGMIVDEKVLLRHGDRVIVGKEVFRFSFAAVDGDFDREAGTEDHCILLERYYRATLCEERSKDALAILKAYLEPILTQQAPVDGFVPLTARGSSGSHTARAQGRGASGLMTPRGSHPVVGALLDDLAMFNSVAFRFETELAEEYPPRQAPDDLADDVGNDAYEAALDEKVKGLDEKADRVRLLREELERARQMKAATKASADAAAKAKAEAEARQAHDEAAAKAAAEAAERAARGAEAKAAREAAEAAEAEAEAERDSACVDRSLEAELQWHKAVKAQRAWHAAPLDEDDRERWQELDATRPFLSDPSLGIERCDHALQVCDVPVNAKDWLPRCVCLSPRFIYVFRKRDGRERLMSSLYVLGATTVLADGPKPVLDVIPACLRAPSVTAALNGAQCMLRLQFPSREEAVAWQRWIDHHAAPPPPATMAKRVLLDLLEETGQDPVDNASLATSSSGTVRPAGQHFDVAKEWTHDSTAKQCQNCQKKFGFFRRRHHCRECGCIFCADCLRDKRCGQCLLTTSTPTKLKPAAGPLGPQGDETAPHRTVRRLLMADLPHSDRLQTTLRAVATQHADMPAVLSALAATPSAEVFNSEAAGNVVVDLFRFRVHTFCAADVKATRRVGATGRALCVVPRRRGQPLELLVFATAAEREHCREAFHVLSSCRCVFAGVPALQPADAEEREVVVEHVPEGEASDPRHHPTCVLSATNAALRSFKVWAGTDDGRIRFQQRAFSLIVILGRDDRTGWDDKTVRAAGLAQIACVPVPHSLGRRRLYVFVAEEWMGGVDNVRVVSTGKAAVAFTILETSVLCIAADGADAAEDDFVDIDEQGTASDMAQRGVRREIFTAEQRALLQPALPAIDAVEQSDLVLAVRCRDAPALKGLSCGQAPLQVRARGEYGFRPLRTSYFHLEGEAAVATHPVSLFDRPAEPATLPTITLLSLKLRHIAPGVRPNTSGVEDPATGAVVIDVATVALAASAPHEVDPSAPALRLVHTKEETVFAGGSHVLLLGIPGVGTATVPFLELGGGTVDIPVHDNGELSATALVTAKLTGCALPQA